jgi:iron complex transport system ATP-binding protein
MNKFEIEDISLSYNHHPVVQNLSFQLNSGEMVGLLGPNGCGKTSVIRAMSRSLSLRTGSIRLDGREIGFIPRGDLARQIGVVPQNPILPDTFSVLEVVLLGRNPHLGFLKSESARDMAIVNRAMESAGIAPLADRKINELSGGEKQRVTIARILAQEPKIILLDEPTANLDISRQVELLTLVKALCKEKNLAVLIAIHDLNLAAQYCDRLLMLTKGRLYAEGTSQEVITAENIWAVYGMKSVVCPHPENALPVVLVSNKSDRSSPDNIRISGN